MFQSIKVFLRYYTTTPVIRVSGNEKVSGMETLQMQSTDHEDKHLWCCHIVTTAYCTPYHGINANTF